MDPNAPQFTPAQPAATDPMAPAAARKRDPKLTWGLVCLIGPTALIVVSIMAYAIANFIISSTAGPDMSSGILSEPSVGARIVNVILFIIGAISVITWLPGLIIGIALLATRKK